MYATDFILKYFHGWIQLPPAGFSHCAAQMMHGSRGTIVPKMKLHEKKRKQKLHQVLNPLVMNGLSHPYYLDEFTSIFRGIRSFFHFISFFYEFPVSKQNSPRWDAAFCRVTSGAILFSMSHKKDTRLM